jgi:hypothetical protein
VVCALEKLEAAAFGGALDDDAEAADLDGADDGHHQQADDHRERLQRVRPHHRLQTALKLIQLILGKKKMLFFHQAGVENADCARHCGHQVHVDAGHWSKFKLRVENEVWICL